MTAFVAGATGFVGRAVVERLCERKERVIAHVRPSSPRLDEWKRRFPEIDVSPWERDALSKAIASAQATHVYCCIGTTRAQARADALGGDIYEQVDHQLTRMLCDAAVASGRRPRIIYLSSIGADATARSAYFAARGRAEDAVRGCGLPWIIVRPSMIAGAGEGARRDDGRALEKAGAVALDGVLAVAGLFARKTRARYRSITPEALSEALVRFGQDGEPNRVYDGVDLR
jgi:nucleoside-diphosphate-sugar epimerase